jgi:hypothetical protein
MLCVTGTKSHLKGIRMETIQQGTFKIIRIDGTEELVNEKPTIARIQKEIGAGTVDTVMLNQENQQIMVVDDTGMINEKPVNPKATALYLSTCRPGTDWGICGDVVLVNDQDFAQ